MEDMKTIYFIPLHQCGGKTRFWNNKNMEIAVRVLGGVHELFYPPPPSEFKKTWNIPCLQVASWTYKVVKISSSFLDLTKIAFQPKKGMNLQIF